jgi:hypothetical protein
MLAAGLVAVAPTIALAGVQPSQQVKAATPDSNLWIKFAKPKQLVTADIQNASADVQLAATTLQGAYNQQQRSSRIYLFQRPEDEFWLKNAVPKDVKVKSLSYSSTDPNGALEALLKQYGKDIKGAIITDPNNQDTVNVATTMAGIDDAMVITPSQESLVESYGIKILHDFRNDHLTGTVATYEWAVQNLLPKTTTKDLVMLDPTNEGYIRDYAVATKSFVFFLTSTDADQKALMDEILQHTPANTPIMGYIPNEGPDVAELSSQGHFLNASDFLDNETVWASMPSPPRLVQRKHPALDAKANTVYVAFMVSDGDNAQYVQHRMQNLWQDPDFGKVPVGWTIAPGMIDFAPTLISYYYQHLPKNSELLPGPSGIGYATAETGSNLAQFAKLSGDIMRRDDMSTVDYWGSADALDTFAKASGVPSISFDGPLAYETDGNSVLYGQTSGYISSASSLLNTIEQQATTEQPGQPLFLEPLIDAWNLTPTDIYNVAQQLVASGKQSGKNYVFVTPSQLASTMKDYYSTHTTGPSSGDAPYNPPGNIISNPSGEDGTTNGWTVAYNGQYSTLTSTQYDGSSALEWQVQDSGSQDWVSYYPPVQNGKTYTFSVQVAGSGQAFMDVWDGTEDIQTIPVKLSSGFQTLTWTGTIPANAPGGQNGSAPQLQVREAVGSPTVYIRDASVVPDNSNS